MLGAIGGDIAGSIYELKGFKGQKIKVNEIVLFKEECRTTDDTYLTLAVANAILTKTSYSENIIKFVKKYSEKPKYEKSDLFFKSPFSKNTTDCVYFNKPGLSRGNGLSMSISAISLLFDTPKTIVNEVKKAAIKTHNSDEAINTASALAITIFLARKGYNKNYIEKFIKKQFGYNLNFNLKKLIQNYAFSSNAVDTVPLAIATFLNTNSYLECIETAISIGGDTDTNAAMAGSIAEMYYGIDDETQNKIYSYLTAEEEKIVRKVYTKIR